MHRGAVYPSKVDRVEGRLSSDADWDLNPTAGMKPTRTRGGVDPGAIAPLALLGYVLIRGCDASVLKWLQAFATAGVLNRLVATKPWSSGLTIGLSSLLAALVFGVVTLLVFGPAQFLHLRWWWLMGLLVSLASAHVLLGERLGPRTLLGAGLVLAGLLAAGTHSKKMPPAPHEPQV